ncbi:hypothetical protein ABM428_16890 (plasmid) [Sulfitobacter sp. TCYB15]|uniref:Uncharacterized protein n=1 Tax=Sulfitobacter sp. TCYB15 TaxID=3229275 RepID=A0AAU8C860_9RHOB
MVSEVLMSFIAWRADQESKRLHSSEAGNPQIAQFSIKKALKNDFGREVVRMHWSHRPFATRYDVVRITYETNQIFVPILGLDGNEQVGIARLGYDLRKRLGVPNDAVGQETKFDLIIEQTGLWGQIYWYLCTKDPAVKVPAWLAFWSVLLGAAGLMLAIVNFYLT